MTEQEIQKLGKYIFDQHPEKYIKLWYGKHQLSDTGLSITPSTTPSTAIDEELRELWGEIIKWADDNRVNLYNRE